MGWLDTTAIIIDREFDAAELLSLAEVDFQPIAVIFGFIAGPAIDGTGKEVDAAVVRKFGVAAETVEVRCGGFGEFTVRRSVREIAFGVWSSRDRQQRSAEELHFAESTASVFRVLQCDSQTAGLNWIKTKFFGTATDDWGLTGATEHSEWLPGVREVLDSCSCRRHNSLAIVKEIQTRQFQ